MIGQRPPRAVEGHSGHPAVLSVRLPSTLLKPGKPNTTVACTGLHSSGKHNHDHRNSQQPNPSNRGPHHGFSASQ
jgi:hypothetical protein